MGQLQPEILQRANMSESQPTCAESRLVFDKDRFENLSCIMKLNTCISINHDAQSSASLCSDCLGLNCLASYVPPSCLTLFPPAERPAESYRG